MGEIMTFRGKFDFLSNMHAATFEWDGRTYRNSEAAFQSAKSLDPAVRDEFSEMTGVVAKREGKKVKLRGDWESVKDEIMEEVVRAKFSQNPDLLQKLIDTGDIELMEGNAWHDAYWGVDLKTGKGENHLGIILMKIRAELGGAEYVEKARQMQAEKEEAKRSEEAKLQAAMDEVKAELESLPAYDFTGMEMGTKAFGRVKILEQEADRLKFEARDAVKMFSLPGCIVQGFLIPDDPGIVETFKRRQELQEKLKLLEKGGLPKAEATGAGSGNYHEENRDLFVGTEEYHLAHCISADFSMSKGIVTQFNKRFGIGNKLKESYPDYAAAWSRERKQYDCLLTGRVFNLVTKEKYNYRPTYDSVRGALEMMRGICETQGIKKVAMPKIASGLDRLQWDKVSGIIREVFGNTDIEIMVCIPE